MNQWRIWLIAAGAVVLLLYVFAPGVFLRLGLLLYPKEHERRREFIAELHQIKYPERSLWVAGVILHCIFEGALIELPNDRLLWISMEAGTVVDKFDPVTWEYLIKTCTKDVAELSAKDRRALNWARFRCRDNDGLLFQLE
jgi:hypothetical protein